MNFKTTRFSVCTWRIGVCGDYNIVNKFHLLEQTSMLEKFDLKDPLLQVFWIISAKRLATRFSFSSEITLQDCSPFV